MWMALLSGPLAIMATAICVVLARAIFEGQMNAAIQDAVARAKPAIYHAGSFTAYHDLMLAAGWRRKRREGHGSFRKPAMIISCIVRPCGTEDGVPVYRPDESTVQVTYQ